FAASTSVVWLPFRRRARAPPNSRNTTATSARDQPLVRDAAGGTLLGAAVGAMELAKGCVRGSVETRSVTSLRAPFGRRITTGVGSSAGAGAAESTSLAT